MNTKNLIQKRLEDIVQDKFLTVKNKPLKPKSKPVYIAAVKKYLEYGPFEISIFSTGDMDKKQIAARDFRLHSRSFCNSLDLAPNSKNVILNIVSMVLNSIAEEHCITIPRIPIPPPVDQPIMVLPDDFVVEFLTTDTYNSMSTKHKMMWEVCAIMMSTSLRVSDAVSLTVNDFDRSVDGLLLIKQNRKTGSVTAVPLPKSLSDILLVNITRGLVYTRSKILLNEAAVRRHLSEFFYQFAAAREVVIVRKETGCGMIAQQQPLYKAIHPHMLRKTAITFMLANGVSEEHVKFASGHSAGSKSFERYRGFSDARFKSQINKLFDKMLL